MAVLSDVVCGGQLCYHQLLPPPQRHGTPRLGHGEQDLPRRPPVFVNLSTKSHIILAWSHHVLGIDPKLADKLCVCAFQLPQTYTTIWILVDVASVVTMAVFYIIYW